MKCLTISLLLLFFTGCSWFSKGTKEDAEQQAPRVIQSVPVTKVAQREPGALWSEDSRWNSIYTVSPSRMPGDVITIKVNEPFKQRIISSVNQNKKPGEKKVLVDGTEEKNAKTPPAEKKEESREPASISDQNTGKNDTKTVDATILEVLPNGFYRVGVNRAFKIGKDEPYVTVEGSVREKEISTDETVSSDSLLNLKIENFDEKKNKLSAAAITPGTHKADSATKKEEKK